MSDPMDQAAVLSEAWTERCLGAVVRKVREEGTRFCVRCDEEIPAARRAAYPARLCIACQEWAERRRA